jgi:hypothetical protein
MRSAPDIEILEISDATSFLESSRDFLLSAEAENNLLLSSAWTMAKSSMTRSPRLSFFIAAKVKDGAPVAKAKGVECAALNSSERRLLLSACAEPAAAAMGEALSRRGLRVRAVLGPVETARAFITAYVSAASPGTENALENSDRVRFVERFHQRIMRLESLLPHDPAPGLMRAAKEKDFRLLLQWSRKFSEECHLDETPQETEMLLRRYLQNRQLFVWEDNQPVAMAGFGGATPNGVRVNMVYTDPRFRGRGYAATLVHGLSRRLLADGHRFCFLFTDSANPVSNRIYERLGYRAICDFAEYRLVE